MDTEVLFVDPQYLDQRRLGNLGIIEPVQQVIRVVARTARERPGCAGHNAFIAIGKAFLVQIECFVAYQAREDVDEYHGMALVGQGEGVNGFGHDFRANLLDAVDQAFRRRRIGFLFSDKLANQLIGAKTAEQAHRYAPRHGLPTSGVHAGERSVRVSRTVNCYFSNAQTNPM